MPLQNKLPFLCVFLFVWFLLPAPPPPPKKRKKETLDYFKLQFVQFAHYHLYAQSYITWKHSKVCDSRRQNTVLECVMLPTSLENLVMRRKVMDSCMLLSPPPFCTSIDSVPSSVSATQLCNNPIRRQLRNPATANYFTNNNKWWDTHQVPHPNWALRASPWQLIMTDIITSDCY